MNADAAIANGNDLMLSTTGVGATVQYQNNPTQVRYMRKADTILCTPLLIVVLILRVITSMVKALCYHTKEALLLTL